MDYRLLLVGAMLPDIIDKPLGIWLLRETLSSSRVFGHTLLFAAVLAGVGLYLYVTRRRLGALCLALGTLAHLILDQMWLNPRTLFWPLYGLSFEKGIVEDWLPRILTSLVTKPSVYLPEIIGALLLAAFFWDIIRHGKLTSFLRSGRVD
ncbi:metal-dependent hydrolase [Chloroflexota bacterium]